MPAFASLKIKNPPNFTRDPSQLKPRSPTLTNFSLKTSSSGFSSLNELLKAIIPSDNGPHKPNFSTQHNILTEAAMKFSENSGMQGVECNLGRACMEFSFSSNQNIEVA